MIIQLLIKLPWPLSPGSKSPPCRWNDAFAKAICSQSGCASVARSQSACGRSRRRCTSCASDDGRKVQLLHGSRHVSHG